MYIIKDHLLDQVKKQKDIQPKFNQNIKSYNDNDKSKIKYNKHAGYTT